MDHAAHIPIAFKLPAPGALARYVLPWLTWVGTLLAAMVMIGWSSAAALGLIGNYASDTAAVMKLRTSPAALKTMLPVTALQPNPVESTPVAVPEVAVTYAATPVPDVATSTRKMIATLGLSVREFPAKESALVAALHQGELVDAGATRSGWVLVTTRDGLSGWAWGKYLEVANPHIAADSPFWTGD